MIRYSHTIYEKAMKNGFYQFIFNETKKISAGKVSTYGLIAESLRNKNKNINGHLVGWVLHRNKSREVPCHRVVDRNGRLAPNFAFDGAREQRRRLRAEGVEFIDDMHVDLEKYLWER